MKILIAGLVKNEQLARLQEEGKKRGHTVDGCYAAELTITAGKKFKATLRGKPFDYDVIYVWTVGKRRFEWYTAMYWLASTSKVKIVNSKIIDPSYLYFLTPAIDYLKQADEGLPFPKSAVIHTAKSVESVAEEFDFPAILKLSAGRQGKGVFKVESPEEAKQIIKDHPDSASYVLREFIPNDGDVRVFTVGHSAIGAMARRAVEEGEFRSNISLGGEGNNFDLAKNPEVRKIAERLSELTRTEIAGVDIMLHKETGKPYILEINPGPQFTGMEKFTGVNAAGEIIKYFEKLAKSRSH